MSSAWSDHRIDALMDRAWRRSRTSVRERVDRVCGKAWHIGQCAIAAAVAWFLASGVFHHQAPVFAPIVAVVCLGTTYAQRLRRVAEITVGVAVGLIVADLFLMLAGTGAWQIGVIVLVAMSAALFLDAGGLLVTQAAVQSIFVVAFVATPGAALTRWFDAVIGGAVALLAAAVVPAAPLRRPRSQAAVVVRTDLRTLAASCLRPLTPLCGCGWPDTRSACGSAPGRRRVLTLSLFRYRQALRSRPAHDCGSGESP